MANFNDKLEVERSTISKAGGIAWWQWLLGLLALLAVLFIILPLLGIHLLGNGGSQQANNAANNNGATAQPTKEVKVNNYGSTKAYTNLEAITAVSDKSSLDGKQVQFTHVKVSKINGAESFFVGDNTNAELFTVLDAKLDEQLDKNNTDAQEGQYVDLQGTLKKVGTNQVFSEYGFDKSETDLLHQQQMYLLVNQFKQSVQQ